MIDAINATLNCTPKGLDSVDVSDTRDVLPGRMLDNLMSISKPRNPIITGELIREYYGLVGFGNISFNHRKQCLGFNVGDNPCDSIPVSLHDAHNNLFEYAPSRFVSDTQFPLELLCRDTCLCRSHQEDSVKPRAERGIRFVEDSASHRGYLSSAELARVNLAVGYAIVWSNLLALWASYALWITSLKKKLKASVIVGELILKILNSVGLHFLSPYTIIVAQRLRDVKG